MYGRIFGTNTMTWKNLWSFPTWLNRTSCDVKVSLKVFNIFFKEYVSTNLCLKCVENTFARRFERSFNTLFQVSVESARHGKTGN